MEQTSTIPLSVDDNAKLVALQLGNTYGLVFLIATAVLYTTSEIKVVRNYLVACWLADISHVYVCYHVLGWARFVDVASWNSMTWGNVGATVSLSFLYEITRSPRVSDVCTDYALLDEDSLSAGLVRARCSCSGPEEARLIRVCLCVAEWMHDGV